IQSSIPVIPFGFYDQENPFFISYNTDISLKMIETNPNIAKSPYLSHSSLDSTMKIPLTPTSPSNYMNSNFPHTPKMPIQAHAAKSNLKGKSSRGRYKVKGITLY